MQNNYLQNVMIKFDRFHYLIIILFILYLENGYTQRQYLILRAPHSVHNHYFQLNSPPPQTSSSLTKPFLGQKTQFIFNQTSHIN